MLHPGYLVNGMIMVGWDFLCGVPSPTFCLSSSLSKPVSSEFSPACRLAQFLSEPSPASFAGEGVGAQASPKP